jgi:hypothetical protein
MTSVTFLSWAPGLNNPGRIMGGAPPWSGGRVSGVDPTLGTTCRHFDDNNFCTDYQFSKHPYGDEWSYKWLFPSPERRRKDAPSTERIIWGSEIREICIISRFAVWVYGLTLIWRDSGSVSFFIHLITEEFMHWYLEDLFMSFVWW